MSGWPTGLAEPAATAITASAVVIAVMLWMVTRRWRPTMPVFLELLLAAGLLRLSAADDWNSIAAAGAIVVIRTVVRGAAAQTVKSSTTGLPTSLRTGLRALGRSQLSRGAPPKRS